ncbi:MAG: hypothetical protein QXO86_01585 [Nitrososphaerota archaeon]
MVNYMSIELHLTPLAIVYREGGGQMGYIRLITDGENYLASILAGEECPPVREVAEFIRRGDVRKVYSSSPQLITVLSRILPEIVFERVKPSEPLEKLAVSANLAQSLKQYREAVWKTSLRLVEESIRKAVQRRDLMIVQAVNYLDDLQKIINMAASRLMEWFGTHFPELREFVSDPQRYAELVYEYREREGLRAAVQAGKLEGETSKKIAEAAERSVGVDVAEQDKRMMWELASTILDLIKQRGSMEKYVRNLMDIEAPNLSSIAGPILGARLISLAGGLQNLAKMPASTIQVLGAEKALFRFFKTGRGAPKHGVIFQHPYVHSSPKWQRGKIARTLATKIALAARIDYYSREDRSAEIKAALEKRVQEIKQKYASPPIKARQPGRRRSR